VLPSLTKHIGRAPANYLWASKGHNWNLIRFWVRWWSWCWL